MTYPFDLRIICHAYARRLPLYASMLRFQIASMIHHPPKAKVMLSVFCCAEDHAVHQLMLEFMVAPDQEFTVECNVMPESMLFRRAIARHEASQQDVAAVLYYADADYCFGPGCLDAMAALGPQAPLCIPEIVLRSRSREAGAMQMEIGKDERWPAIDPRLYSPWRERRAIGGLQLIGADAAKRIGYLAGTVWHQPVDPALGFTDFKDDSAWRRSCGLGPGQKVPIPNLYRIRHSPHENA